MSNYLKNAGWIFCERFLRIAVGFILFALVSRTLSPNEFGLLSYYQTIATMLLAITNLGFDNILINEFNQNKNNNEIFSTAFWSRIFVSVIVIAFFTTGIYFSNIPLENKIVLLLCILSLVFQTQNTYISYFQSQLQASIITRLSIFSLIISSLFKIYLLVISKNIVWFAFSYSFDFAVSFLCIVLFSYKRKYVSISLRYFQLTILKKLLHASWPIIASSIVIVLYTRLDQIMIMNLLGPDSVAKFNVALKIAEAYVFVPAALVTSYYPLISKSPSKENIRFYFDVVFFSSVIMTIGVSIVSYFLLPLMFGVQYTESYTILVILLLGSLFSILGAACTNLMIVYGLSYLRLIRALYGLVINFSLNFLLIPKYGVIGAAYASLASQIFATWLSNCFNRKTIDCFKIQSLTIVTLGILGFRRLVNIFFKKK
ncbi:flippase [Escherichia albertii]|uniref:flippase n=1 Tax=Escherichia albertii TaxID=208962 RepID=UPI0010F6BAAB|nr:flippase [Escherichia albertii]MCU7272571.1 flippase [Escherichia albertii]